MPSYYVAFWNVENLFDVDGSPLRPEWLQFKPLKDPRSGQRVPAWHWDLKLSYLERVPDR